MPSPAIVGLPDFLHNLEKARTPSGAVSLQCRRHGQTDSLLRPRGISHDKAGVERIQPPLDTLHRSIKTLQVNGYVLSPLHLHQGLHLPTGGSVSIILTMVVRDRLRAIASSKCSICFGRNLSQSKRKASIFSASSSTISALPMAMAE